MNGSRDTQYQDEIDLLDLFLVIAKNRVLIFKITFYSCLLSVIISLLLPNIYRSSVKILPPQNTSSLPQQFLSSLADIPIQIPGKVDYSSLYSELVKSNDVIDYAIERNNLREFYKEDEKDDLREIVRKNIITEVDKKSGIITISYLSKEPEVSYNVVRSLIEGLKKLNDRLAITVASQKRLFYEEQLLNAKENLIRSEEDLKTFQFKIGSVKVDEELKAAVEEASALRAKISAKEVELSVLKKYVTPENTKYKNLVDEIAALKEQLSKLQSKIPSDDDALLSAKKASTYGIEYIRKMREFKYNESLYEILLKQYEIAKLEEARDPTIIQIVEKPEIPQKRFKPKRRLIVAITTILSFFFSVFLVFVKKFIEDSKKDEDGLNKILQIKEILRVKDLISEIISDFKKVLCIKR